MKKEYLELVQSGMLFEFYPQLTGDWERDKEELEKAICKIKRFKTFFLAWVYLTIKNIK